MESTPYEITFTRQEFYDRVWSTPATALAQELGCSDVMISKVCKSHDIPKPYPGYWSQVAHGKRPPQTPLPMNGDWRVQTLTFHKHEGGTTTGETPPEPKLDDDFQRMLDKTRSLGPVRVSSTLDQPHPLVAATRDRLAAESAPRAHRWETTGGRTKPTLNVEVSPPLITRAPCIMDALIKRVEEIGGEMEIQKVGWGRDHRRVVVRFGGEDGCEIRIREKQNQKFIRPEGRFDSSLERQLTPSGFLYLDTRSMGYAEASLRDTADGQRVEDGLNDLIISLVKSAGLRRIDRIQTEQAYWKSKAQAASQEAEQARVKDLLDMAEAWHRSQELRQLVAAMRARVMARDGAISEDSEAARYLRWANEQAHRLDPLSRLDGQTPADEERVAGGGEPS